MPWIWYANRTLGRHLVMPGDCCSHWLGFASRSPLKWQHLFFHSSILPFIPSLIFSLFFAQEDAMLVMVVKTWQCWGVEEKSIADHFPVFYMGQKMVQIHFSQWLTRFQNYVTQKIKKKENEWKWILFMCNSKWQLFIPFSWYRETDAIKRQQLSGTFHTTIYHIVHGRGERM